MDNFSSELQTERVVRGSQFEDEIRRSWRQVPNVWRMKISDGRGGTRPGDNLILSAYGNILSELKRTYSNAFHLYFLRANQAKALRDFDQIIPQNYGLVFVSFQNETIDEAYAFRLLTALEHMRTVNRQSIKLEEFQNKIIPNVTLNRIFIDGEPGYELRRVLPECRYL